MDVDAVDFGRLIETMVNDRSRKFYERTFRRGIVYAVVSETVCDVQIDGATSPTLRVPCLGSYLPIVGQKVLVLSIGESGSDLIVLGPLGSPIGEWVNLTLNSPWTLAGGGFGGAQCMRDANGWVHLRGSIVPNGSTGVMFTLPVGYRPAYENSPPIVADHGGGRLQILTNGQVTYNLNGTDAYISLVGVRFRVV